MGIRHVFGTNGSMKSKRFVHEPKPPAVNVENLRREMRLSKDSGHAMMKIHHCIAEQLFEAWITLHGEPEDDFRRIIGS